MRNISKSIYLNTHACSTLGWLLRNDDAADAIPRAEPTVSEHFRIEEGIEVGIRARTLYSEGLLIDESNFTLACARTQEALEDQNISVIFEGAFFFEGFAAKADVLIRDGINWQLAEVKSSINDRGEFIDDMAYTLMVLSRCGVEICATSLLLVSRDFRLGMDDQKLLVAIDHTADVFAQAKDFGLRWQFVNDVTSGPQKPAPQLKWVCKNCQFFGDCMGKDIDNHVFDIPRLSESKFDQLSDLGIYRIEDIPDGFSLTANQATVRDAVMTQSPLIKDALESELAQISWPASYLDFESVMTAIPLYPDIPPHTQIPTQYSIHQCDGLGSIINHVEYLADHTKDCRLELAASLVNDLTGEGSIIVYGNFEKTIIGALAKLCPQLAVELNALIDRLINLEAIMAKNLYHPDFHGSNSLKSTLPVLVADMSYDGLHIRDGGSAMATFAYMAQGKYQEERIVTERQNLLTYCQQDTLALVKLHARLAEFV